MNSELEQRLRERLDKDDIRDQILRFARGIDRYDRALVASVFHEDAIYDHYGFPDCPPGPEAITNAAFGGLMQPEVKHVTHFVPQTLVELDGDVAFSETYGLTCLWTEVTGQATTYFRSIRLLDRWERRDGRTWKIAYRTMRHDGFERRDVVTHQRDVPEAVMGRMSTDDLVYHLREHSGARMAEWAAKVR